MGRKDFQVMMPSDECSNAARGKAASVPVPTLTLTIRADGGRSEGSRNKGLPLVLEDERSGGAHVRVREACLLNTAYMGQS